MSQHAQPIEPIPDMTRTIVQKTFPKGCFAMRLRDELGPIYQDVDFASLFPKHEQASAAPWRLAIVTILQAEGYLSDRQTADMVSLRLDWKYALSLALEDNSFEAHFLTDFRQRLVDQHAQEAILGPLVRICNEHGWLIKGGQKRIDSALILAIIERVNSMENVIITLQTTLDELADVDPDWLLMVVTPDWFDRYTRSDLQRFPTRKEAQKALLLQMGEDSRILLSAALSDSAPEEIRNNDYVQNLKKVYQQYFQEVNKKVMLHDKI